MIDHPPAARGADRLSPLASRERAVGRFSRGVTTLYVGVGGLVVVVLGSVFGGAGVIHMTAVLGAGLLIGTGCVMMASAMPHFLRYGQRFSAVSMACFAAAGLAGLIGMAEMFESFFLNSTLLETWGAWAVRASGVFAVAGGVFLRLAGRKRRSTADGDG